MDWRNCALILLALLPLAKCWTAINSEATGGIQTTNVSPYIDIVLCPIRTQPWSCAREQSGRILDIWDDELQTQWQKLKVEADRQLNATIEKRGYSATEVLTKEKPSTILKKIEIGTGFMKEYLSETMDGFLGREYEYMTNTKNVQNSEDNDGETVDEDEDDYESETAVEEDTEDETEAEEEADGNEDDDDSDDDDNTENENANVNEDSKENIANTAVNTSGGDEFIEINDDANKLGQLKRPSFGNKGNKNRKKKKGHQSSLGQPATLVVVQPLEHDLHENHDAQAHGGHGHGGGHGGKQKRKRKKKQRPVHVEEAQPSHFGLSGLLDEFVGAGDLIGGGGGKKKFKHSTKYGRSNGVTRGKKKKKKKALAKLILLGTFLKAKIELLLKILGAHLQIKFFAIALIGLLINIARFWIDVKRGGTPQKVVYVEHAHHQHHYEEQPDDWSEPGGGGGGYWKRSLQTDPSVEDKSEGGSTDSYQPRPQPQYDAQYLAYRNQWQ